MARHSISQVIDDRLILSESANQSFPAIQVGSEAWYAWLNEPDTRSFAFHSAQGTLTARREHSHSTWYWYAYRTREGHLHKTYLGKSEELTLERLQEAVTLLSAQRATRPQPPPWALACLSPTCSRRNSPSRLYAWIWCHALDL